jgi:dephospho-CoA kinase
MKKVIGLIGPIASGKDTAAEYISKKLNIPRFEISQPIKEIAKERGITLDRWNLVNLGNELSKEKGDGYLAEILLDKSPKISIITGMRQLGQIDYLRKNSKFSLILINAKPKIRFQRANARKKPGESQTLNQFIEEEIKQNTGGANKLFECIKLADHKIENNSSQEELFKKIDALLAEIL